MHATAVRQPDLEGFSRSLDALAELVLAEGGNEADAAWVRNGIIAAETKIRTLRFIADHATGPTIPRVLDIGAQNGSLAFYAKDLGLQVSAVDLDFYAEKYGRLATKQGIDYRTCDVSTQSLPYPDDSIDFVTYLDIIEHHGFSPKSVLTEIKRVLRPGGYLILSTPNHASLFNRAKLLTGRSVHDDIHYFFNDCAEHRPYRGHHREYTKDELRKVCESVGFQAKEIVTHGESVRAITTAVVQSLRASKRPSGSELLNLGAAVVDAATTLTPFSLARVLWVAAEKPLSA
jgi:SAM-dependent methyltransferase